MRDKILLRGAQFFARHGASPAEQETGGRFLVDLEVETDLARAGQTDALKDTTSYAGLHHLVRSVIQDRPYKLVESVAERIAAAILESFLTVAAVRVRVLKTPPPLDGIVDAAGVEIYRTREEHS